MKNLFLLATILAFFGCSSPKQTSKDITNTTTGVNYCFNVSFISIGEGTDLKAKKEFDQYLADYKQKNKEKLVYETTNWGREGEVDFCFKFTKLDKIKQDQFMKESKELLKKSSLVLFSENVTCPPH